jgi:hypothetical protein
LEELVKVVSWDELLEELVNSELDVVSEDRVVLVFPAVEELMFVLISELLLVGKDGLGPTSPQATKISIKVTRNVPLIDF